MQSNDVFGYILMFFVIFMIVKIYYESDYFQLKCIISEEDGNRYCVRERNKMQLAADLLARTTKKMKLLVKYMIKKYPDKANVKRLKDNFDPKVVVETLPTSEYTAYSENKGQKLAFCVTTTKEGNKLIDENTLTFVAMHELAHCMTASIGHKAEFWQNFKFLIENAKKMGIYKADDYKKNPVSYCGMEITDNPLFDL
jgi:hypothetical protein